MNDAEIQRELDDFALYLTVPNVVDHFGQLRVIILNEIQNSQAALEVLLDNFASGKINSDDWKKVEKILGKRFFINHDGKTSTERSGHE